MVALDLKGTRLLVLGQDALEEVVELAHPDSFLALGLGLPVVADTPAN